MPVIPAVREAEAGESLEPRRADHLRSGVQDQPDQHGETCLFFFKELFPVTSAGTVESPDMPGGYSCLGDLYFSY